MSRSARPVTVLSIIRDCLDALLHPSARYDALTRARHRAFMAPRLLGSLAAFAAFPVYLAMRGAPSAIEVAAFAWLIAPILLSWFLSRTGHYEGAHVLSSLALAGLIMAVVATTGGIESFAAIWLVAVPLEAALSASRRAAAFASLLALSCAGMLILVSQFGWLPPAEPSAMERGVYLAFGVASATLYAAGLAFGAGSLARTSVALLSREEGRYRLLARNMSDVISRHQRGGAVQFISPAAEACSGFRLHNCSATVCSTASMSPIVRPISPHCRMQRVARSAASSSAAARQCGARTRPGRFPLGRDALPAARSGVGARHGVRSGGRRGDARRYRSQEPGAGARRGA